VFIHNAYILVRVCTRPPPSLQREEDPQIHADGATSDDPEADSDDELTD
jgi:hypothetical protein